MIVRVVRGADMAGVLRYLAGPGRDNEHVEPHLVAGDGAVMAWWSDTVLDRAAANAIGGHLDRPRATFAVDVAGGHVWHAPLSVGAEDGQLSDERWGAIARDVVAEMGFTEASGKAGCRWVAVRHGMSKAGNDHVHLVVSLVRDDGTKASTWHDWKRASAAAAMVEERYGLAVLTARAQGRGAPGVTAAEVKKSVRLGEVEPVRGTLARRVRAYAVASRDEAEFVRRVRAEGLLVRPRFAADRADVVLGYSVAAHPPAGERPVWFGGGHLGRDLALPRLRDSWPDTPEAASTAVGEWTAAARHRRPLEPGRETRVMHPGSAARAAAVADIAGLRAVLRAVPLDDRAGWARVAHDTAGVFGAWSARLEPTPGVLAATADVLARSAQLRTSYTAPRPVIRPAVGQRVAMLLLQASAATPTSGGDALLLRQLIRTAQAVHAAVAAVGDHREAVHLAAAVDAQLAAVHSAHSADSPDAGGAVRGGPVPVTTVGRDLSDTAGPSVEPAIAAPPALDSPLPADLGARVDPGVAVDPNAVEAMRLLRVARAHPAAAAAAAPAALPDRSADVPPPGGGGRNRGVGR